MSVASSPDFFFFKFFGPESHERDAFYEYDIDTVIQFPFKR